MATYTVTTAKHATLTANVVDTVTFPRDCDRVEVVNRGNVELYFTLEGQTPTIGGDNAYIVMPGGALQAEPRTSGNTSANLISGAATAYSVTASGSTDVLGFVVR